VIRFKKDLKIVKEMSFGGNSTYLPERIFLLFAPLGRKPDTKKFNNPMITDSVTDRQMD